jgi:hypothetical protein
MLLQELFDQPYKLKLLDTHAEARDSEGRLITVDFDAWPNERTVMVTFERDHGGWDPTSQGDQYRVLATVIAAVKAWAARHQPECLYFSAGPNDPPSRHRLYHRLSQQLGQQGNYQYLAQAVDRVDPTQEFLIFYLKAILRNSPRDRFYFLVRRDLVS